MLNTLPEALLVIVVATGTMSGAGLAARRMWAALEDRYSGDVPDGIGFAVFCWLALFVVVCVALAVYAVMVVLG